MRVIKMATALPAALALAWAAPAAATLTVNATVTGFLDETLSVTRVVLAPASSAAVFGSRMTAQTNSGTFPNILKGGTLPGGFAAFCIEPLELINVGTSVQYNVVPLSQAARGMGGIGTTKANQIRELFGRYAADNGGNGGYGAMTGVTSMALQLAIWEIVMETRTQLAIGERNPNRGNFSARAGTSGSAASAITLATTMLNAINGTGPLAQGLVVLQHGAFGVQGNGSQDLLAFVPEPASWAMLIAGFGLTGASLRRRRAQPAA